MKNLSLSQLKELLDKLEKRYNHPDFVTNDPISIPSSFTNLQDIEISGFFTAIMSWGLRKTIIKKSRELMGRMDNSPYQFIVNASEKDLKAIEGFCHRTLQPTDVLYLVDFLKRHYEEHNSLEAAFLFEKSDDANILEWAFINFNKTVFNSEYAPRRTQKHIANPLKKSTCKRLNMMMRWFVRKDDRGVDLGIWNTIQPSQLMIPLDVHVDRVARRIGLLKRKQTDWQAVKELTAVCRQLDRNDPGKYDFALFGAGLEEKYGYF
jgi:uncharacterized protein (TIGR02757 family)